MEDKNKNNIEPQKWVEETKSGFVKGIIEAFDGFVKTFKQNGLATVTFILVLFMILYSFILNPININDIVTKALQQEDKLKQEQMDASVEQRLQADKLILTIMNHLTQYYNVDRCLTLEMHNGSQSLTGSEFLFLTATAEVISDKADVTGDPYELDYIADNFSKQHISNVIGETTYNRLKTERYLYYGNLDKYTRSTYRLINKLKMFGAKSVILIPFVSQNKPLVILVCCSHHDEMDAEAIYKYVEGYKLPIEKYLMNI